MRCDYNFSAPEKELLKDLKQIDPKVTLAANGGDETFQVKDTDLVYKVRKIENGGSLYCLEGVLTEPLDAVIEVENGSILFLYCTQGASIFSSGGLKSACVPGNYLAIPGPAKYVTRYGRGEHRRRGFVTRQRNIAGTIEWSIAKKILNEDSFFHGTTVAEVQEITSMSFSDCSNPIPGKNLAIYYALCSAILGAPSTTLHQVNNHLTADTDERLASLMAQVQTNAAEDWSLAKAAAFCSYSVFHFSRLFKSSIGIGFPEFVAGVRAKKCLNDLLTTGTSTSQIASQNGMSSAAIMREALRDLFGFTTTEIRQFKELDFERLTA